MAFDLDQLRQMQEQREQWLHQAVNDEEEQDHRGPPPLSAEEIIGERDDIKMHAFTNFTCDEFETVWTKVQGLVTGVCSGGSRSRLTPKTWFLVALFWTKNKPSWRVLGESLDFTEQHVARKVLQLIIATWAPLAQTFIRWISMDELVLNGQTFANHPNCIGAVDASVQKIMRPSGDQQLWYSGKHKCHCIKVQAMVSPTGMVVDLRGPVAGSVHDLTLYNTTGLNVRLTQEKNDRVQRIPGSQPIGALFDKGYIGVTRAFAEAIVPVKRPVHGVLNAGQVQFNRRVGQDRVIVERWFGRHKTLWAIMSCVYPLHGVDAYAAIYQFCAALTNFHISLHPLVDNDAVANQNLLRHLRDGGVPPFHGQPAGAVRIEDLLEEEDDDDEDGQE